MAVNAVNIVEHIYFSGSLLPSVAAAVATTITRDNINSGNCQTAAITISLTKKAPLLLEDKTLLRTSLLEVMLIIVYFGIGIYLILTKLFLFINSTTHDE